MENNNKKDIDELFNRLIFIQKNIIVIIILLSFVLFKTFIL